MPTHRRPAERSDTIPEHRRPRDRSRDNRENWYRADGIARETYTVAEAAAVLGIGLKLAYEMARTGALRTAQLGRRRIVPRASIDSILNGGT